ncbi:MAG: BspA family leucine-rich repeat surface protein, partial [archaeon]|nr:BspA family leucine-rich repeat surface protein [archaeon]
MKAICKIIKALVSGYKFLLLLILLNSFVSMTDLKENNFGLELKVYSKGEGYNITLFNLNSKSYERIKNRTKIFLRQSNSSDWKKIPFGNSFTASEKGFYFLRLNFPQWDIFEELFMNREDIHSVTFGNLINSEEIKSFSKTFQNCSNLKEVHFGDSFKGSQLKTMSSMFKNCTELSKVYFGKEFKPLELEETKEMFEGCLSLCSLDLSQFSFKKVIKKEDLNIFGDMDCERMNFVLPSENITEL